MYVYSLCVCDDVLQSTYVVCDHQIGRLEESVPRSKRLLTDETSNVLVYMTGIF